MSSEPSRSAAALAASLLRADPHYPRIPEARRVPLAQAALDDGRLLARTARACWGNNPWDIAHACQVPVLESGRDASFGSTTLFAEYVSRPASITLYGPRIDALNRLLEASGWAGELALADARPVFLAHELYHHFDCEQGASRLSGRHRLTRLRVGPLAWTFGLPSLEEIAAGAFAQELLGLDYHPHLLDLLLVAQARERVSRQKNGKVTGTQA